MPRFTFNKEEKLKSRKLISQLFQEGKNISFPPLRLKYLEKPISINPAAVAVVVPKRVIKKAVDRNLLKRRMRESYRLFKPEFYELLNKSGRQVNLMVIYQSGKIEDYKTIDAQLKKALRKLALK